MTLIASARPVWARGCHRFTVEIPVVVGHGAEARLVGQRADREIVGNALVVPGDVRVRPCSGRRPWCPTSCRCAGRKPSRTCTRLPQEMLRILRLVGVFVTGIDCRPRSRTEACSRPRPVISCWLARTPAFSVQFWREGERVLKEDSDVVRLRRPRIRIVTSRVVRHSRHAGR
mgnify:CR=1 FL=1